MNERIQEFIRRNRNGDEYYFVKVEPRIYTIVGNLKYWRYGGKENQEAMDWNDLGFVDPSGGPFISVGDKIENQKITRISLDGDKIYFEVE